MRCAGRRSGAAALLLVVLALISGCSDNESIAPPKLPDGGASGRAESAQRLLTDFVEALRAHDDEKAMSLAVPEARAGVRTVADNAARLGLDELALRFVDDQSVLSAEDRDQYGASAWAGTAELSYRISGWDARPARLETRFVFRRSGGEDLIAGIGGGEGRTPLWLGGQVGVASAGRALVVFQGSAGDHYLALASQALADVRKVLPDWRGRLVLEVPASEDALDHALAAPQEQYANIAAVTTTVDGSLAPGSPVHVFLNPRVFDGLGPRGAQVVVSHETTHVATDATFAQLPTWLLEGFADYVALAHAGIPVDTAASQILARIRKAGPPDHLPTSSDLDPTANGLGATYEEAWLATRFIAQEYGEGRLVQLYEKVSAGEPVEDGFRTVLGTTESAFVQRWRVDLRRLADGTAS